MCVSVVGSSLVLGKGDGTTGQKDTREVEAWLWLEPQLFCTDLHGVRLAFELQPAKLR